MPAGGRVCRGKGAARQHPLRAIVDDLVSVAICAERRHCIQFIHGQWCVLTGGTAKSRNGTFTIWGVRSEPPGVATDKGPPQGAAIRSKLLAQSVELGTYLLRAWVNRLRPRSVSSPQGESILKRERHSLLTCTGQRILIGSQDNIILTSDREHGFLDGG
jgi:hypothetical protein